MSRPVNNSPDPDWKEFEPLQHAASGAAPEKSEPSLQQRGGCQFCRSRRFLRSGLRAADIGSLFLLRYPVRCLRCRQRQFTDFLTASLSLAAGSPVYSESKKRENWSTWTSGSDRRIAETWDQMNQRRKSDIPPRSE